MNRWNDVRKFYRWAEPLIMAERSDEWAVDPYEWVETDAIRLTPIEEWLWHDIRHHDAVLYPQYPVGRFFVDFANPKAKVAIECDGAAYHQDKAKDAARDLWMQERGWSVYRITGSDCRTRNDEETGEKSAADLFIRRICSMHNIKRGAICGTGRGELRPASDYMPRVIERLLRGSWRHA
jgi:very-short-patch-repair endonuclease